MITAPVEKQSKTIDECFESLETLFKAYQKDNEFNYQLTVPNSAFNQLKDKVFELKDIEKELEIDLITLYKALKNGIWLKDKKDQYMSYHCLLRDDFILVLYEDIYKEEYLLKDYGKTWALTKEELER